MKEECQEEGWLSRKFVLAFGVRPGPKGRRPGYLFPGGVDDVAPRRPVAPKLVRDGWFLSGGS